MTPTPPSTTSSSAGGHSPDTQYRIVRKRNRVPLSCGPCRHRKLKCNSSHPCENCIRRGDASSCSYVVPGTRKKNQSLVLSLMTNGAQFAGPAVAAAAISRSQSDSAGLSSFPHDLDHDVDEMIKEEDEDEDSDVDNFADFLDVLKVDADKGKSMYLGDSHWHLVLAEIIEVKNYWASYKKELEQNYEKIKQSNPTAALDRPAFLFSSHSPATDVELRSELPPKSAVDKLVTRYFNSYDPAVQVLHPLTFHKHLHNHWQDPSKTSIVWLGLLYSILCLAMQSYHKQGDEPLEWKGRTIELAAKYRLRTVQCLVNSDYTKPSNYTIESLLLYVHSEYASRLDAEVGIWVIVGIIIRLAIQMGYHRDPSKHPGITPYQGEMRRRVWAFVRQLDTIFSFQLALPGMIRNTDCDTALPRNIYEDEFGPDSRVLPPARPLSEPTPVSFIITKAQFSFEFGTILEEGNAVSGKSINYEEVVKRDNRLRELKSNMAPHLRLRPIEECTHDPANLLMQRFSLDLLWQKTMCVLHRKYIVRSRQNSRYTHSRRACVDASMEILRHQAALHRESQPGGRLRPMKWYISSLTKADYLLGAMIVCLDLYYISVSESMAERPPNYDMCFWTPAQRADMLQAVESSQRLWKESSETSIEAYKADSILGVILDKLKCPQTGQQQPYSTTSDVFTHFDENNLRLEQSASMTLGMLSGGLSPNTAANFNNAGMQSPRGANYMNFDMTMNDSSTRTGLTPNLPMENYSPFALLNNAPSPFSIFGNMGSGAAMMDVPANLNWEAWDSYVQNGSAMDPTLFQYYSTDADQALMGAVPNTPGR